MRMPRDGEKIPQVPGRPQRASAPAESDSKSRMGPQQPGGKRYQVPGPPTRAREGKRDVESEGEGVSFLGPREME